MEILVTRFEQKVETLLTYGFLKNICEARDKIQEEMKYEVALKVVCAHFKEDFGNLFISFPVSFQL